MAFDPSEVLIVYLGAGQTGGYQPVGKEERLRAAYPRNVQLALSAIEKYLEFPDYPPAEWSSNDLAKEQGVYEERLARAFPELSARATNALACRWSYGWK
jgi:hypothetical protein